MQDGVDAGLCELPGVLTILGVAAISSPRLAVRMVEMARMVSTISSTRLMISTAPRCP